MPRYRAQFVSTWAMDVEVLADSWEQAEQICREGHYNGVFSEEMTGVLGDITMVDVEEDGGPIRGAPGAPATEPGTGGDTSGGG